MKTSLRLHDLNPQQRLAVETIKGPLLLLAGAGTGKTRVITYRIAHLISKGVDAAQIMAVTFTNKAANEMKERVAALVSRDDAEKLCIGTFHSFGMRLLRKHIHKLGYSRNFGIATDALQQGLVQNLMSELGVSAQANGPGAAECMNAIHKAKAALLFPDDLRNNPDFPPATVEVYARYQTALRHMNLVDFDDLLILVVRLWQEHPDVLETHRSQYRYVMVDEYQDTNVIQFRMIALLASGHRNLCVVGDDDQSIYGWRGADITNILNFDREFPETQIVRLEQNYRSTRTILQAANQVIGNNSRRHDKNLWSDKPEGRKILTISVDDEAEEARLIVEMILDQKIRDNRTFGDCAILYRSNHQSRVLEEALLLRRIPYTIVGSRSFYERKEIMDAVCMLKILVNPADDLSLLRILNVPPRGLGEKALERLHELQRGSGKRVWDVICSDDYLAGLGAAPRVALESFAQCIRRFQQLFMQKTSTLPVLIDRYMQESGYLDGLARLYKPRENALKRKENILEFISSASDFEARQGSRASLEAFLDGIALMDQNDRREKSDDTDGVVLLTVHAAKGLEFPLVFVAGLEQNLFPHQNAISEGGIEEERRLFYVAVTRAQDELILLHAQKRKVRGETVRRRPSVFLQELPEELILIRNARDALEPASRTVAEEMLRKMREQLA